MYSKIKLNAAFLKKINRTVLKNTDNNIGAFELFFELLSLLENTKKNPIDTFTMLLNEASDIEKSIQIYSDFYNAIIDIFNEFLEGKSCHHLINNLHNLIKNKIPDNFNDEDLKTIIQPIAHPTLIFLKSHAITEDDSKKLRSLIKEKFHNEEFSERIVDFLTLFSMLSQPSLTKELQEIFTIPEHYVYFMIENALKLNIIFREIAHDSVDSTQPDIHTEMYQFGTDDTIDYTDAQRNDPCPCGSGKKYKKCCRKAQEFPLTTLRPQKILSKPKLKREEVAQYYELYNRLMCFVQNDYAKKNNKKAMKNIFEVQYDGSYACNENLMTSGDILNIRKHLIANRSIIEHLIEKEKFLLSEEEKNIFESWKSFIEVECIIMQSHNNSEVLAWDIKNHHVYLVYGLYDPLSSLIPSYPFHGNILLFPFMDRIIFDGLLTGNSVEFGNNIIRSFIDGYQKDIACDGITLRLPIKRN